ncbi:MAG: response regulator [Aggregatilineales bacterium]
MPNLFLLEDETALREIFRISIEMLGKNIKLHEFGDSNRALTFIQNSWSSIDLYVLDIRVPGKIDGFELAKEIRSYDKLTPIILTSAFAKAPKADLDFYNFIWMKKPWHLMEIPDKIVPLMYQKDQQPKIEL